VGEEIEAKVETITGVTKDENVVKVRHDQVV
jgi:hypothetical protein